MDLLPHPRAFRVSHAMNIPHAFRAALATFILLCCFTAQKAFSQAELMPWGNLQGIRIEGQLMAFSSSLRIVGKDWSSVSSTMKEQQHPKYSREGNRQIVTTYLDSLSFTEQVEDAGPGVARIQLTVTAQANRKMTGIFFSIALPSEDYQDGKIQGIDPATVSLKDQASVSSPDEFFRMPAGGMKIIGEHRVLEIRSGEPGLIVGIKENRNIRLYFSLHTGDIAKDQTLQKTFILTASGEIDKAPVHLMLNTAETGRVFDGFGGNFRLQNPKTDPQVIDYSLKNLRVAWGRVEMPWRFWQPEKDSSPIAMANAGKLNPFVQHAMEMAQTLGKQHIPLILSAWSAPNWAVVGAPKFRPGPDGVWGNPLNAANMKEIYKSIADYIDYLKKKYGVEISLFSFNESDLGINIRVTGKEHAELIKGLGAYLASRGLGTKMLLGDNSDATTYRFIYPAMEDSAALPYIGAISFHSWRGWDTEILQKWADAATRLHVPLIVGEGSIDAAAWNYPAIFLEQSYALEEINLYTRLLAICQPLSILQWQLTADYSPLAGGGIFGNNEPLHPTQRFWNLRQLASTPKGLLAMPISCDSRSVSSAALGNNKKGVYAFHLVNNGAAREAIISGLPKKVRSLQIYTTNKEDENKEGPGIPVAEGTARFTLPAASFISLFAK
jgi:hypothetical protein